MNASNLTIHAINFSVDEIEKFSFGKKNKKTFLFSLFFVYVLKVTVKQKFLAFLSRELLAQRSKKERRKEKERKKERENEKERKKETEKKKVVRFL